MSKQLMMSSDILELARMGIEQMRQHPLNYFDWQVRREIYRLLNLGSKSVPDRRHQSLALQAAEHVLPLYIPIESDGQLVYQLFEAAQAFVKSQMDIDLIDDIENRGYHAAQWFGYDFATEKRNYQSEYAGFAAYKALVEVRHLIDPWKGIEYLSKGDGVHRFGSEPHPEGWTPGAEFTDEDWNHLAAFGDTAAAAAFAYATTADSDQCNPSRLIEFWEWWVGAALPQALEAQSNAT